MHPSMLLHVNQLVKDFGPDRILDRVTFRIDPHQKVGLVGRNGTGKTTLLRVLTGELEPDGGSVTWARGVSIGYLRQHEPLDPTMTVIQAAEQAKAHILEMSRRLEELERIIESGPSDDDLDEYSRLQEHFHSAGGYSIESDLKVVLQRMGFEESEFDRSVAKLSGGERTRLMLARLLLEQPDLLILDEPTNHLDLQATEWLERWIQGYHGAVLIVSHDRTFLQNVAGSILDLHAAEIKFYDCKFNEFLQRRADDQARQAIVAKQQAAQIAKLDEFVRRFMNSQRTAQARGRLKHMEKLKEQVVEVRKDQRSMAGTFQAGRRAGDLVFEAKGLAKEFGEVKLFQNLSWTVRWGERWGVIGANGAGKSTLVKILMGLLEPSAGQIKIGSSTDIGYFSQDAQTLDLDMCPMQYMNEYVGLDFPQARTLLGKFLLSGDDAIRPMRSLSGGERNKVQLAVLAAQSPNVLVLDEPTNHLDIESREALAAVLKDFVGTLVLVSHDRWLLDETTQFTLDVQPTGTTSQAGSYSQIRGNAKPMTQVKISINKPDTPALPKLSAREISKEIGRLEKEIAKTEDEIALSESKLGDIETQLSNPAGDVLTLTHEHQKVQERLNDSMARWEALETELANWRAQQGQSS